MATITETLKEITKSISTCVGIDTCNNWAVQRTDGGVFDANYNNGNYIGIDAMRAPNGYTRLLGEYAFSRAGVGSCNNVFEIEATFAAVVWATNKATPTELLDKLLFDISRCNLNQYKATLDIESANFVFDEIFKEETASPVQSPAGLSAAKVTFSIKYKTSACNITAPLCAVTIAPTPPIIPYDDDAILYFAAIESTGAVLDKPTKDATNTAIVALKDAGLWLKAYALYFIIGGTSAAHKFNAKNPLDTNAAYRLTFAGGWVHSSTGATPNGTNAFADTFFVPSLNAAVSSITLAYYSRSSATGSYIEMGASGSAISSGQGQLFIAPNISGTGFNAVNATGNAPFAGTPTNAMYIASRTDAVNFRIHRNATLLATNNQPNTASNKKIYIGARNNNGTTDAFSARQCAFAAILSGLSTPEANTFYAIIETFQTALGRNN